MIWGVVVAQDEIFSEAPHLHAEKTEALEASNTNFDDLLEEFDLVIFIILSSEDFKDHYIIPGKQTDREHSNNIRCTFGTR